ncbi:Hypothetical protein UCCLB556_1954 [Levilactobacillus brevis]|nr:Hypothetical protein UCCLB556_1954 [Levilactobacillus brevis]
MKKKIFNTSAARITKVYALLLFGITIILSLVIISVVGLNQFQGQRQQALGIVRGLKRSFIANRDDWFWWRLGSSADTKSTFIRIKVIPAHKKAYYLYSPNTKKFMKASKGHSQQVTSSGKYAGTVDNKKYTAGIQKLIRKRDEGRRNQITGNIHYASTTGFYYHVSSVESADSKKSPGAIYDVWMKLDGVVELLGLLIRLICLITIVFLVIGTWFIYLLARKLNRPLVQLTETTKTINQDISDNYQRQLPVPQSPQEVHDLTVEFNYLLRSLNEQAEADRQFVSNASHELKTPIATIRGYVSLVKRRSDKHPEVIPTALDFIDKESQRMQRLVESLLKLSHANQLELQKSPVQLSEVVEQLVASYGESLPQQVDMHIQRRVTASVNQDSIEQILVSLLNNAQKYSAEETVITVSLEAVGKEITLTVADQGVGITDEQKAHVFDRFYRAEPVREEVAGNGLGLAIVDQLVTLNGGHISIKDNTPKGSIFVVTLPR